MAGSGLAAGLIASLAISGLLLLAERISDLPVGTFYFMLAYALLQVQDQTAGAALIGIAMHLAAGAIIGLAISMPLASRRISKYAPAYGIAAGVVLWAALFIPVTYAVMVPLLNSVESREITQSVPAGITYEIATGELPGMMDRIVMGSLAFNAFYGLLAATIAKSMYESRMRRPVTASAT
jgi:hypothetical protein